MIESICWEFKFFIHYYLNVFPNIAPLFYIIYVNKIDFSPKKWQYILYILILYLLFFILTQHNIVNINLIVLLVYIYKFIFLLLVFLLHSIVKKLLFSFEFQELSRILLWIHILTLINCWKQILILAYMYKFTIFC